MFQNMPFNVVNNQNYTVYLGIGNHLGVTTNYVCYLKLRNQNETAIEGIGNTLYKSAPLYKYRLSVQNEASVTLPLVFSLSGISTSKSQILFQNIIIEGQKFKLDKISSLRPN